MDSKFSLDLVGGKINFILYGVDELLTNIIIPEIKKEGERLQKIFDFYDSDSELSKLNRGREMIVSDELLNVLETALNFCRLTAGKYDVSFGKLFLARKSGKSLPLIACSYEDISINKNKVSLKHDDVLIDLGSIAKGYIGDRLAEKLKELGVKSALIDARGEVIIFGEVSEKIGIQNPRGDGIMREIVLKNSAVATSGDYSQYNKDYEHSHIISGTNVSSATVVANSLMLADVLASVVFVCEEKVYKEILEKYKIQDYFVIDKNSKVVH